LPRWTSSPYPRLLSAFSTAFSSSATTVVELLHHNVTRNPNALWVALQLRETWEYSQEPQRFLIFDRDSKFSADVVSTSRERKKFSLAA
jgi:hypothetical protein